MNARDIPVCAARNDEIGPSRSKFARSRAPRLRFWKPEHRFLRVLTYSNKPKWFLPLSTVSRNQFSPTTTVPCGV